MTVLLTRCDHRFEYRRGVAVHVAGDYAPALCIFRELARCGHAPALFLLGSMYSSGTDVERDPREALKWFLLAAVQGHPQALIDLQAFASSARRNQPRDSAGIPLDGNAPGNRG